VPVSNYKSEFRALKPQCTDFAGNLPAKDIEISSKKEEDGFSRGGADGHSRELMRRICRNVKILL
jgi:hypothetical protein